MTKVFPSQAVITIEEIFRSVKDVTYATYSAGHGPSLRGILDLVEAVPDELVVVTPAQFGDFILAKSTIRQLLAHWIARGDVGSMPPIKGKDAVRVIWETLKECPDSYPPPSDADLVFIKDPPTRDSIRGDIGEARRALYDAQWKAATVLAGASIEALLLWRLTQEQPSALAAASAALVSRKELTKPPLATLENWTLNDFVLVAKEQKILTPDVATAALLAKDYRNLIHPGLAIRKGTPCSRGTAYAAIGALHRVIESLS